MADWSQMEVEAAVTVYFEMLDKELRNEPFNKAAYNVQLRGMLTERSRSSVEYKFSNISAVLVELGYPYVDGYKPYNRCQELLREVVGDRVAANRGLQRMVREVVEAPVIATVSAPVLHLAKVFVTPPAPAKPASRSQALRVPKVRLPVNYLERETRNASLGKAGEEFVLGVERARLRAAGEKRLADLVEHVSVTQGDGLGYDILSFDVSGQELPIEVKTTRYGVMTPFFASRNEVELSGLIENYHLYRVFKFGEHPQIFRLLGSLENTCALEAVQFRATVR